MINIRRHAIIIGSPGKPPKLLRGVYADITDFPKFLLSANGGSFYPNEITILHDPGASELLSVLNAVNAEYVLIYYSGHGAMDKDGKQLIQLKDATLHEDQLRCTCNKTLVAFDACRNRPGKARISGFPWAFEEYLDFTGTSAVRNNFNHLINSSLPGRTVLYATADGTGAYDDDQDGGNFTRALLESVISVQRSGLEGWINIEDVIADATSLLLSRPVDQQQVPQCMKREGNLSVPFAFVSPKLTYAAVPQKILAAPKKEQTEKTLLIAGGVLLAAYLLNE